MKRILHLGSFGMDKKTKNNIFGWGIPSPQAVGPLRAIKGVSAAENMVLRFSGEAFFGKAMENTSNI